MPNILSLRDGWQLREAPLNWGTESLQKVLTLPTLPAKLPCDVHVPLIEAGKIADPVVADGSLHCQWMEDRSWWLCRDIAIDDIPAGKVVELTLEGLDSEADIFFNGRHLGHHRSAFYPFVFDIHPLIQAENQLVVRLTSGLEHVSVQSLDGLQSTVGLDNKDNRSDYRRIGVRKPQYVYGWDWGPRAATIALLDAQLAGYEPAAIRGVHAVTASLAPACVTFEVEIEQFNAWASKEAVVALTITAPDGQVLKQQGEALLCSGLNYVILTAIIPDAQLWWPNGYGAQPLYTVDVSVTCEENITRWPSFQYGIHTLALDITPMDTITEGERDRLFAICVNGERIFAKGGNWVPADSLYARVTDEKYDALVREAAEANFTMLRVWGGGLYERPAFYEACDRQGILVWQDYMFSCAMYPDQQEWFRQEAEQEVRYQTCRLRNHACLAIWSGNNENIWGFYDWWPHLRDKTYQGGAWVYNQLIPRIVRESSPNIPYWNSSPYGGNDPNGNRVGDRHHWHDCTMNADMEKRITPQEYDKVTSKFVSEYGYIGPCRLKSIEEYYGGKPVERYDAVWDMHNNTLEKATVPAGIAKHYTDPAPLSLEDYLLYGGMVQGLMLGYSLESIRSLTQCHGALFWMYNDCWGEVGWTIIDYYLRRKISYYAVKRAFAPIRLILRRVGDEVVVTGINDTPDAVEVPVRYGFASFDGAMGLVNAASLSLPARFRGEVLRFEVTGDGARGVHCVMPENDGVDLATLYELPCRERFLEVPKLTVSDVRVVGGNTELRVSTDCFAHGVHVEIPETDDARMSDGYFDLLAGGSKRIVIFGQELKAEDIKARSVLPR